jgi:DNA-binding NarL/FixJ family response regulator
MRVLLIGSPAERALLRARLAGQLTEVAGEFPTLAIARTSETAADAIVMALYRTEEHTLEEPMTAREIEVLELLTEGLPNKAIAARLRISDQTVKFHVSSICGKLGAANRTDAVRRAIKRGLVTI